MSWQNSLVKIANYEVEQLRKRLTAILDRRAEAELKLARLHAEAEAEKRGFAVDADSGWYRLGYLEGWRGRRDQVLAELEALATEETGARDALSHAFEELKKYEQIAENAEIRAKAVEAKLETAAMDELGGRRAVGR